MGKWIKGTDDGGVFTDETFQPFNIYIQFMLCYSTVFMYVHILDYI